MVDYGLPVGADKLRVAADLHVGFRHVGEASDGVEQVGVDESAILAVAQADCFGCADNGVDVGVGVADDVVDGRCERVGEHEGAGHECDAEQDGECGRQHSHAVSNEVSDGE